MKIVKISALWCPACLITNNKLKKILEKNKNIELLELDYDYDDVSSYNVGKVLPELIFYKNDKEYKRLIGEKTFSGYAASYDDKIKEAIKNAYESDSYKDVVKSVKGSSAKKTTEKESSPIVPIIVVGAIAVVLISGIVILAKKL